MGEEHVVEICIRKKGFMGWMKHLFVGRTWYRSFVSRKNVPELESNVKDFLDGAIADIETISYFN